MTRSAARELAMLVLRDPEAAKTRVLGLLAGCRYVRAEAARRLGISTTVLRGWIDTLGVEPALREAAIAEGYAWGRARPYAGVKTPKPSFVYFFQAGPEGPIKIGWSADVRARLDAAQVCNHEPLELLVYAPGNATDERKVHLHFDKAHIRGEWFRPTPDLIEFIEGLREGRSLDEALMVSLDESALSVR